MSVIDPTHMTTTTTRPTLTPLLLAVLALLSAFTPLSIDMYLPALPVIAVDLAGSVGDIQLTLSAFMIAFGVGQIFYGPAGDRFGRRPVILGGLAIYVVASVGCAFAAAAGQLVLLRFLQGLAACGGVVLARTMVRDLAERDQAARAMSLMMACTSIAPMVAPVFGAGKILRYAVIVPAIVGPAALALGFIEARYGTIGMWPFVLLFAPQIATISLIGPNSMAMALQRYPHMAGTASSLMGVLQFGLGAVFGAVVGQTFDGSIAPMTTAMGLAGALCFLSNRLLVPKAG